jgi:DNA-binding XRE family transcriptional regulator
MYIHEAVKSNSNGAYTARDVIRLMHDVTHVTDCDYQCRYDVQAGYRASRGEVWYLAHIKARRFYFGLGGTLEDCDIFAEFSECGNIAWVSYTRHKSSEEANKSGGDYKYTPTFEEFYLYLLEKLNICNEDDDSVDPGGETRRETSLARLRLRAGFARQVDAAEMLNVDQTAVSKWETGASLPRPPTLLKLATLYGCTVDELLRGGEGAGKGGD